MKIKEPQITTPLAPPVSIGVLIAARNEASVLNSCIQALDLQSDPPDAILWVDDGSNDSTQTLLKNLNDKRANKILSIFKAHSGKADSLNQAWPKLQTDIIVTLDADTLLEPGAIAAIRRAFSENENLAATGGILTPTSIESPRGIFESFQQFEYMRSFLARRAWMEKNALLLVSGAFAAYRKKVLAEVGGFDPESLVEDYDLTHRIHRFSYDHDRRYEVQVTVGAHARTDVPGNLFSFLKQRRRWFSGFLQTQFKNRDMVGNRKYGSVGSIMLLVKSVDTLQPAFGLFAFFGLLGLLVSGRSIPPLIWKVLVAKIILDLFFHYYSLFQYGSWKKEKPSPALWFKSTLSTFCEPFTFQILRHFGAILGWLGFLRGKSDWTPQRTMKKALF